MGKKYTIDWQMFSVETGKQFEQGIYPEGDISGFFLKCRSWPGNYGVGCSWKAETKNGSEVTRTVAVLDFEGRGAARGRLLPIVLPLLWHLPKK